MFANSKEKKILTNVSALELIPVVKHGHKINEDGNVVILIPKFKSEKFARWFIPKRKSIYYSVKLDKIGTEVYLRIDGSKTLAEICSLINQNNENPIESLEQRASAFISNMYSYKFITFKQLQDLEN